MSDPPTCPRCGSDRIIPNVRILDRGADTAGDLSVALYSKPDALIFKGRRLGTLSASICASCGHAELTVSNPAELWSVYQQLSPRRRPSYPDAFPEQPPPLPQKF